MLNPETLGLLLLLMALGAALGVLFFGGLWWTVKCLPQGNYPAALLLLSFAVRITLLLLGFYWLMDKEVLQLLALLLGVLLARLLLNYSLGKRLQERKNG